MSTLLITDDEPQIVRFFELTFEKTDVEIIAASTGEEAVRLFSARRPDVVCLDVHLPDQSGLQIFRQLHERDVKVPIILMTGAGTTDLAIEAMRLGAYEYLLKPLDIEELKTIIARALEISHSMRIPAVPADAKAEGAADVLVGRSSAMQNVYKVIGRVAPQDVTVLILGESGTGKELVARAIYHYSRRAAGPFLAMNCAAIPENLLESELFGHEKGAFSGADQRRIGKFEQCSGGTLFLDEIGDMSPLSQTKVLRVIQNQWFERIGGNQAIHTDVRLIAATNRDLESLVAAGRFRQDLFYRLNIFTIRLPPLRERLEDLPLLVDHFLGLFRRRLNKEIHGVTTEAMEMLKRYSWPGNVRELESALIQAMVHASGPILLPEFFSPARNQKQAVISADTGVPISDSAGDKAIEDGLNSGSTNLYAEWLAVTSRRLFIRVFEHTNGNLTQAAKILGLHPMTLRSKLRALGIKVGRTLSAGEETKQ